MARQEQVLNRFVEQVSTVTDELTPTRQEVGNRRSEYNAQNKLLGQLIAKSWLSVEEPNRYPDGAEIRAAILKHDYTSEEIISVLKKYGVDFSLISANEKGLEIEVSWSTFNGVIEERPGGQERVIYTLPYPPRPNEVTTSQLEKWVNDTDPTNIYPDDPYIPLTGF